MSGFASRHTLDEALVAIRPQHRITDANGDVLAAYDAMGLHRVVLATESLGATPA